MKKFILVSLLFGSTFSFAQTNELVGQYYQNLPAYSPSQAGMNDFLDINMGFRQQWVGFNGSPKNIYLSAYGILKAHKSKQASVDYNAAEAEEQQANPGVFRKHGLGGYIMSNTQGYYNQREIAATYAYHIPVMNSTYVSVGMSPSVYVEKIDMMNFTVKDQANDEAYQSLVNNGNKYSSLQLNIGASVYSDKFYISYSMRQAGKLSLNGNRDIFSPNITKRHHFMGGMVFHANSKLDLIPNTFVRFDATRPLLFEAGLRARYNHNIWGGLSYRNDRTILGAFGLLFKDKYKFSYAYEHKNLGISKDFGVSNASGGTHEFVIGMQMFKYKKESF
jgi:type IX secretion system PorP/SprF family membrane protein